MRKKFLAALALTLLMGGTSHAEDITIHFNGTTAKVKQQVKDSVSVKVDGAHVNIESTYKTHKLTILMSGKSDDGQLILKTDGKAQVKLEGLNLTSQEGAPLWLKNKKKVEIKAPKGTVNTLTVAACTDTANHKAAVIWAKDKLKFTGRGTLNVLAKGDGCKGIRSKDDITIEELTLNVETTGNNLGAKENPFGGGFPMGGFGAPGEQNDSTRQGGFGGFGGFPQMGGFGGGMPDFSNLSEEDKARIEEMRKNFEEMMKNGNFPMMGGFGGRPEGNDSTRQGGFGGFGGFPQMGGFGAPPMGENGEEGENVPFKQKYNGTCKGIKSQEKIIVNGGRVTVKTTSAGAEGIEGKKGVILNGGDVNVLAIDDAINANAAIEFNGANVVARSTTNDAVDANLVDFFAGGFGGFFGGGNTTEQNNDPAIIITGGTVYAWSQRGAPEEGLDCDFSPIKISGGTVFSVGAGMGEMPSVPTQETAEQPTALLIGINIVKDEPIQICDSNNQVIDTLTVPFALRYSSSIVTSPKFQVGGTYTVKTKDYEKTFTLNEKFTIVR